MPQIAYCIDVSSISGGKFAWARRALKPAEEELFCGSDFNRLSSRLREDLSQGAAVALGLEAPLYMLAPKSLEDLNEKRKADLGERAVVSGPAATSALSALQQLLILLENAKPSRVGFSLKPFLASEAGLYLWEAFVGKQAATKDKDAFFLDAVTALACFCHHHHQNDLSIPEAAQEGAVLNLAGAALACAGLAGAEAIREQPLVLRPESPIEALGGHPARLAYSGRNAGYLILSAELVQAQAQAQDKKK